MTCWLASVRVAAPRWPGRPTSKVVRTIENETRFTRDLIHDACSRLGDLKDEADSNRDVSQALSWAPMAMNELAYSIVPQILDVITEMEDEGEDREEAVSTAIAGALFEGLLLGAICADVSWERKFLATMPPP